MSEQSTNPADTNPQATFNLQRIYLKDLSFESPKSPSVFQGQWQPSINLEINTRHNQLGNDTFEVILSITVTARNPGEEVAFLIEVQQAGIFQISGLDEPALLQALGAFCPNLLFPYVREAIDSTAARGSFPALHLAPVNFDAVYAETLKRRAEIAATEEETRH